MSHPLLTEFMMEAPYQPATNYWRAVEIEEVIKYGLPDGQGLDLGCGDGHLIAIILRHAGPLQLTGIDIDPHETALARARNVYRQVVTAKADHMPFPDAGFDFVFSNSVLEHIENIDGALKEVARVLRPGGKLLFTVPGPDFHKCLKGPRASEKREGYLRETDARCFHLRYWTANQWTERLGTAGLRLVHQHEYFRLPEVQRWEWIARNTSGILYKLVGRTKQPIEIQRRIGVRRSRIRLPRLLASIAAKALDFRSLAGTIPCGCLLLDAKKL